MEVIKGLVLPGIDIEDPLARTPIEGTPKNLQELSVRTKSRIRWLMNLVVRRIGSLLPMVSSDLVASLIKPRYLLPWTLPKDETSCIVLRTLGPFDRVLVDLLPKDVVARIVADGLRWHSRRVERWRREG